MSAPNHEVGRTQHGLDDSFGLKQEEIDMDATAEIAEGKVKLGGIRPIRESDRPYVPPLSSRKSRSASRGSAKVRKKSSPNRKSLARAKAQPGKSIKRAAG